MEARVGTLAIGTRFRTLLTGREGAIHAIGRRMGESEAAAVTVEFVDRRGVWTDIHPDVRVRVLEVTH